MDATDTSVTDASQMLSTVESDLSKLEQLYTSLSAKANARHLETSQDRTQWISVRDGLLTHVDNLKNAMQNFDTEQRQYMADEMAGLNQRQEELLARHRDEVQKLQQRIKDDVQQAMASNPLLDILSQNPYSNNSAFLDELQRLNELSRKEWQASKQHSRSEIERVLKMLSDESTQGSDQQLDEVTQVQQLQNEVETLKSSNREKDEQIAALQRQLSGLQNESEKAKQQNTRMDASMSDLGAKNNDLKQENDRFNAMVNELKSELLLLQNQVQKQPLLHKAVSESATSHHQQNEDKLIAKLQETWQVLYQELGPASSRFDDVEEIKQAFKAWKKRQQEQFEQQKTEKEEQEMEKQVIVETQDRYMASDVQWSPWMLFLKDF